QEKIRMENEIEKLKLSALHDAHFFGSSDELLPEVESEWLKYIAHFEKNYEDVDQIKVDERLERPEFPAVETLSKLEIEQKLDEVQQLMADHGIFLDVIVETADAEIYRFITEELFEEEIEDVDIEGLQVFFIYEEFYPNDELDIELAIDNFIAQLFDERFHSMLTVAEKCRTAAGKDIAGGKVIKQAIAFSTLYDQLDLEVINSFEFNIDEQNGKASVSFYISYMASTDREATHFEGKARASMVIGKLGYWDIRTLEMPGFAF